MSADDLELLRTLAGDRRRRERLAERISHSLGESPRQLPSRTALALEQAARGMSVIATTLAIGMFVIGTVAGTGDAITEPSLLASVAEGQLSRAEEVYTVMSGITSGEEVGR